MHLVDYASKEFSQNGEDGIIRRLFAVVGERSRICCEIGAWDGVYLSNTRGLVLRGWRGVFVEGEHERFLELSRNYPGEICVERFVGDEGDATIDSLLDSLGVPEALDLLSIDVDGIDYYLFGSLRRRPRVVCVEVNAGHSPRTPVLLDRSIAARDIGQPLAAFDQLGRTMGYRLVAFTGNAIFLHESADARGELPTLTPADAYGQFVARLDADQRRWLYAVNLGIVPPFHRFRNRSLTWWRLGLSPRDAYRTRRQYTAERRLRTRLIRRAAVLRSRLARPAE